jgi:predicted O-linked N-acetylglucosamine transferase (SPINDLY family)
MNKVSSGNASDLLPSSASPSRAETEREGFEPRPSTGSQWSLLGQKQLRQGLVEPAIGSFKQAAQMEPDVGFHWGRLGKALAAQRRYDDAEPVLQRACTLEPDQPVLHVALAQVLQEQNRAEAAIEACRRAMAVEPYNFPAFVTEALMLQPVYSGSGDLESWRNRFSAGLTRVAASTAHWLRRPEDVFALELNNFYLAYQGQATRSLQSSYSEFLGRLLSAAVPDLRLPLPRHRLPRSKVHVGFVSSNLRACTIGAYFRSWITDLPRDRFHVCTLFMGGVTDAHAKMLARESSEFVSLTGSVEEAARVTRARELDIVVFPDVGTSVGSTLLANLRLAPVQCAAWGHPVTTGSEFVDYFLSCSEMEPAQAADDYRERLVLLPGLGTRYPLVKPAEEASRDHLGLPPDKRIYVCPQSLYKIHPDSDNLFLDILARDEDAVLLFFGGLTDGQRQAFLNRLALKMKTRNVVPRQQIKVLPVLSQNDFRLALRAADVMLDAVHWSGGSTALDALCSGLPIVTMPGRFMRGRQSAAMLRIVGAEELIARDAEEYVQTALRVARDKTYRRALSERIRANLPRLLDRSEPIEVLADAFETMAASSA